MNPAPSVIHFNCQTCGTLLTVPIEMAGVTGPCPNCRASITSPKPAPPAPSPEPINPFAAVIQHQQAVAAQAAAAQATAAAAGYGPMATKPSVETGPGPAFPPPLSQPPQGLPPMAPPVASRPVQPPANLSLGGPLAAKPTQPSLGSLWNQTPGSANSQPASTPALSPLLSPPSSADSVRMTGAWPPPGFGPGPGPSAPSTTIATAASAAVGRGSGAHPVMDRLLHATTSLPSASHSATTATPAIPAAMPASTPAYQERSSSPPKQRRVSSSRDSGRRGAMWMAVFMAVLVMAGVSWFFRDQLEAAWLSYTMKDEEEELQTDPTTAEPAMGSSASTPPNTPGASGPGDNASTFDPNQAPSLPKVGPISETPPLKLEAPATASEAETPAVTSNEPPKEIVLPPLPANSKGPAVPAVASGNGDSTASKSKPAAPDVASSNPNTPPKPSEPSTSVPVPLTNAPSPSPAGNLVEVPSAVAPSPPVNAAPPAAPVNAVLTGITPETKPALDALQKFFHAKTWEERLPFVQAPKSMKPLMESYYSRMPDGPLYPSHIQMIRHIKNPETGPPQCVFQVSGGGLKQPLPLMVETTEDGWKVDWLTFTEFKDDLLLRFLESPQTKPARFHVLMRRAHYFDDDVPSLDKKMCFQVMPPSPGFTGDVFAIKGTPLSRELERQFGWDVSQGAAVVELQWRKDDRYQWVEMTDLVQLNWRNVEPANVAAKTSTPDEPTVPAAVKAQAVE